MSWLDSLFASVNLPAPGTSGNLLQSSGSAWQSVNPLLPAPGASGNMLQSNGSAWVSSSTSASGWIALPFINFASLANQTFSTDGTYTVAGYTNAWTKGNSTNDRVAMAIVNGTGLVISPGATGNYYQGTKTLPYLSLNLASAIANLGQDTPLRVTIYESSSNETTNSDAMIVALEHSSTPVGLANYYMLRTKYTSSGAQTIQAGITVNQTVPSTTQIDLPSNYANNVLQIVCPNGIGGHTGLFRGTVYSSSFPNTATGMTQFAAGNALTAGLQAYSSGPFTNTADLLIGACRNGNADTAYTATIAGLQIEYKL